MAKDRNNNQLINQIESKPFEQQITAIDYIDTLKANGNEKNILKMIWCDNKELHSVSEWKNIIKT